MDELDLTDAEKKATYQKIKEYVLVNIPRKRYHRSTVGYRPSTDAYRGVASAKSGINPHKDTALLYNRS